MLTNGNGNLVPQHQPEEKEITDATGLGYATVTVFLKKNAKDFKTTGTLKNKRFFEVGKASGSDWKPSCKTISVQGNAGEN